MKCALLGEYLGDRLPEGTGDPQQVEGRAVSHAALDATHVAASDGRAIRECFLGQALTLSQLPDSDPLNLLGARRGPLLAQSTRAIPTAYATGAMRLSPAG